MTAQPRKKGAQRFIVLVVSDGTHDPPSQLPCVHKELLQRGSTTMTSLPSGLEVAESGRRDSQPRTVSHNRATPVRLSFIIVSVALIAGSMISSMVCVHGHGPWYIIVDRSVPRNRNLFIDLKQRC